jgi:hypothetical protein
MITTLNLNRKMNCYTGCTTKELIAIEFSRDRNLQSQVKRMFNYKEYCDDVVSDITLYILELKDDKKLVNICLQNNFNYWLFAYLKNRKKGYDGFYKKNVELTEGNVQQTENEHIYLEEQMHKQFIVKLLKDELNKIEKKSWYNFKIFNEYLKKKEEFEQRGEKLSFVKFGKEMNIDKDSLWHVISKVKSRLKSRIDGHL